MGTFINSMYDLQFNLIGLTTGFIGVLISSVYQVVNTLFSKKAEINF